MQDNATAGPSHRSLLPEMPGVIALLLW